MEGMENLFDWACIRHYTIQHKIINRCAICINVLLVNTGFSFVSYPLLLTFKTYIMKKIFTLLFTVALFSAAQGQNGSRENRDNRQTDRRNDNNRDDDERDVVVNHNPYDDDDDCYRNDDRYGNSRFSNERKMKMQIARINQEFDYKIQRVRNNYYMSRWEKQRQIHSLEDQRQREIRIVYAKFKNKKRYDDHHDYSNRRHY